MVQTIGIIGGMGPEATNKLCSLITEITPAEKDQDHIPVITFSNPYIPDRTESILGTGQNPLPALINTADILHKAGANLLLMPCNTAHYFLKELRNAVEIPVLDMISETVEQVVRNRPEISTVGLLATTGTIESGLYTTAFRKKGINVVVLDPRAQEALVMEAIYGPEGIKAGRFDTPRKLLLDAVQDLITKGAEIIIAGCTEIPLVLEQDEEFIWVDPARVLATIAVKTSLGIPIDVQSIENWRQI